jgi:streptogramin lyase
VIGAPIKVGGSPYALAVGYGEVWVANSHFDAITRIDASTGTVIGAPIDVGSGQEAVAVGLGSAWVASDSGQVIRIDAATGNVIGTPISISDYRTPYTDAIAVGDGDVWVADFFRSTVTRIQP